MSETFRTALEGYRTGTLTPLRTRLMLGFEILCELDQFLKAPRVSEHACDLEDLEQNRETMRQLRAEGRVRS